VKPKRVFVLTWCRCSTCWRVWWAGRTR